VANYELRTTMTTYKNINEEIINYLDNEGDCERCGCNMCEEDWEHDTRELFVSNTDGKNICRRCVREEDELEDEETRLCGECGAEWNVERLIEGRCNACYNRGPSEGDGMCCMCGDDDAIENLHEWRENGEFGYICSGCKEEK